MVKKCHGTIQHEREAIAGLPDHELQTGLKAHSDPEWWKQEHIVAYNQAYLRRWGTVLRREARQRGLL